MKIPSDRSLIAGHLSTGPAFLGGLPLVCSFSNALGKLLDKRSNLLQDMIASTAGNGQNSGTEGKAWEFGISLSNVTDALSS
ncbi:hypothetical protein L6452_36078 [Arctium lappa]|uniref:Uncharacterized protein n=1 Tax=Arctium lappa TaxID=4217 RepID=A0ACB8Y883_ARCLA|nr:hypothetical protein L6452_36078 [Arctium lappa]